MTSSSCASSRFADRWRRTVSFDHFPVFEPRLMDRFAFPTTIHFGAGARRLVADHLKAQGVARPLIVTDRGIAPLPLLADFVGGLSGLATAVFSDIGGNPVKGQVDAGVTAYK